MINDPYTNDFTTNDAIGPANGTNFSINTTNENLKSEMSLISRVDILDTHEESIEL